ncbi:hypothetical protein ACRAQ7_00960 [Erythrobacter sp. W53]|uniref:hypothetical protein n=1 Tax=Erythrobacter sp. W53 TaxID=3425947 RepID=UPI003D76824D
MRLALVIAACAGTISAFPAAASPQPEFLALEELQAAAEERSALRGQIRSYVREVYPICPLRPPQAYAQAFGQSEQALKNLIASFQDKQLILDVNIAYRDELAEVVMDRTRVRCAVNEMSEAQAQASLNALNATHLNTRISGNRALHAVGYVFDDAVQPDAEMGQ